jgi:invasion protein IalB
VALWLLGGGAAAQSEEPQPQILETLQDWTLACLPASAERPARCELFQEMTVRETGQRVFRLAMRLAKDGAVEASALAPFGLKLRAGITYSIDDGAPFVGEFLSCFATGCLSRFVVPEDILAELESGTRLTVEMDVYEGERFRVQLALPGLSDGLGRLRALAQE